MGHRRVRVRNLGVQGFVPVVPAFAGQQAGLDEEMAAVSALIEGRPADR